MHFNNTNTLRSKHGATDCTLFLTVMCICGSAEHRKTHSTTMTLPNAPGSDLLVRCPGQRERTTCPEELTVPDPRQRQTLKREAQRQKSAHGSQNSSATCSCTICKMELVKLVKLVEPAVRAV